MKQENPKAWWKEVKRLCGSKSFTDDLINQIQVVELADATNKAFLDPLEEYRLPQPLNRLPVEEESAVYPKVSEL